MHKFNQLQPTVVQTLEQLLVVPQTCHVLYVYKGFSYPFQIYTHYHQPVLALIVQSYYPK